MTKRIDQEFIDALNDERFDFDMDIDDTPIDKELREWLADDSFDKEFRDWLNDDSFDKEFREWLADDSLFTMDI